jgi:adenylyl cyclase-associated protein
VDQLNLKKTNTVEHHPPTTTTNKPPPPSNNIPPPPPPSSLTLKDDHPPSDDRGALLSALSGNVTGGLRKVQDSEKKRPGDGRTNEPLQQQTKKVTNTPKKETKNENSDKVAAIRYDNARLTHWVEYYKDKQDIVIEIVEPKQKVYVRGCVNTVITVVGKCTNVSVENSKATSVIFDDVIATAEVVNSQKVQLQANKSVPSIILDKTDGCHIYILSPEGLETNIVSSICSSVLVSTPGQKEDDDMIETPLPEQFITNHNENTKKWVTHPTEHSGV